MPANEHERRDALPRGTVLRDYTIEAVLGHGGFGIVYRARHNELGNRVAIKEYLPVELALREGLSVQIRSTEGRGHYEDGLRRFLEEARALVGFHDHAGIVSCRDFFRANGTAYLVMEHEEGLPLAELLRRREAAGRPFAEADLLAVMVPLLEGLARVHEAGALHRDIKPSNILVRRADERPVLIDFGAAKQGVAERSKSMAPYTEGYAALEQVGEGELGPWTDLYAAGAVMWRMAAGGNPPWEPPNPVKVEKRANAVVRGAADPLPSARELGAGRFSAGVLEAIDRCLQLNEQERVRDCGELLGLLRGAGAVEQARAAAPPRVAGRKERGVEQGAAREAAEAVGQESVPERRALPAAGVLTAGEQAGGWRRRWSPWVVLAAVLGVAWLGAVLVEEVQSRLDDLASVRKAKEEAEKSRPGRRFRDCAECPQMVVVPAGSFLMGSPESEEGRWDDEGPVHWVEIGEPLAVGGYEVTFEEWDACAAAGGCGGYRPDDEGWGRGRRPVINVSWKDAQEYMTWLRRKTGEEYRLLNEAEWEYAARAGTRTRYSFGDDISPNDANYYSGGIGKTQPVGSYRANGFGLYDMHGNVWEWVHDCWNGNYRGAPSNGDAWERGKCGRRVWRGGAWSGFPRILRAAIRSRSDAGVRYSISGFRVARTLTP